MPFTPDPFCGRRWHARSAGDYHEAVGYFPLLLDDPDGVEAELPAVDHPLHRVLGVDGQGAELAADGSGAGRAAVVVVGVLARRDARQAPVRPLPRPPRHEHPAAFGGRLATEVEGGPIDYHVAGLAVPAELLIHQVALFGPFDFPAVAHALGKGGHEHLTVDHGKDAAGAFEAHRAFAALAVLAGIQA